MGVPYVPVVGLAGSDLIRRREDMKVVPDPFDPSVSTVVARAYRPQVALLHAHRADRAGNVDIGYFNEDVMLAEASRTVIVTAEELVDDLPESAATGTFLPSLLVDAVVHAPFGAHPGACPGRYGTDEAHLKRYVAAAADDQTFAAYLRETVFEVPSHEAYVERFVPRGPGGVEATAPPAGSGQTV